MLDKLKQIEEKYNHLEAMLSDPAVASDPARFVQVMKDYRALSPIMEAFRAFQKADSDAEEARGILEEESDEELRQLANEQWKEAKDRAECLREELTVLLLPRDPND